MNMFTHLIPNRQAPRLPRSRFSFTTEIERDDETFEVEVGYDISRYYPATRWEPASGGEVEIIFVTRGGERFGTTNEEDDLLRERAAEDSVQAIAAEKADYADRLYDQMRDERCEG